MSQLKATSLSHKDNNTGTPNITMYPDGTTSLNYAATGFKNQIINGDFLVWQRGISFDFSNGGQYTADRWRQNSVGGANAEGSISNSSKPSIASVAYYLKEGGALQQGVELPLNGSNKGTCGPFVIGSKWTLSVWSDRDLTGTSSIFRFRDGVSVTTNQIDAADNEPNWTKITTVADNGFHRYAATFTINKSPNDTNVCLNFNLPSTGEVGGSVIYALCQLEPGPTASDFEIRPIGTELSLCQRYYQTLSSLYLSKVNDNGNLGNTSARTVQMRTDPNESATPASSVTGLVLRGTAEKWNISAASGSGSGTWQVSNIIADAEL